MKMICDVPDEVIKSVRMGTWCGSSVVEKMIANGTPIPDNAKNGDIVQMMFPDEEVNGETDLTVSFSIDSNTAFTRKWWNSPYQKGGKE